MFPPLEEVGDVFEMGGVSFTVVEIGGGNVVFTGADGLTITISNERAVYGNQGIRANGQGQEAEPGRGKGDIRAQGDLREARRGENAGEGFSLESASAEEVAAEQRRGADQAEMKRRQAQELDAPRAWTSRD